jgi:hypothetical protein
MQLYHASVHEPGREEPLIIDATSHDQLKTNIKLRINCLARNTRDSFILSLLVAWMLCFILGISTRFWTISLVILLPVVVAYITYAPYRFNPIARTYHFWRCLKMWRIEYARNNAWEAQDTYV